jgi:CheY-like chemotaxis protein
LAAFEKGKYDLVITDLGMPGMSGLELTEALKKEDPAVQVAMITGWGAQLNQKEMLEKGVFKVVAKPFYLKDVRELIATVPCQS